MGIALTVLEPPHLPEPNLVAALPPGTGRVIDVEPRLVSPRYDTLLVTSRGLVVRDHVTGNFHGVPWANFSVEAHLRQHSRHAILILWVNDRRPVELGITRRLALNIASVAPVLKLHPDVVVDDIVIADQEPIDLRQPRVDRERPSNVEQARHSAPAALATVAGPAEGHHGRSLPSDDRPPTRVAAPPESDRFDHLPPPDLPERYLADLALTDLVNGDLSAGRNSASSRPPVVIGARPNIAKRTVTSARRRQAVRLAVAATVLVLAGVAGAVASTLVGGDDTPVVESSPTITSEAVEPGTLD